MINKLEISNLKLHNHTLINMCGLTLLTGMNGMGKSSVIQSLLLLRQSFMMNDLDKGLNLKGDFCEVGTSGELSCQSAKEDLLVINLAYTMQDKLDFSFTYPTTLYDTFLNGVETNEIDKDKLSTYSLFNTDFQYLGAFRFGPQKSYDRDTSLVKTKKQLSKSMGQCEYVIHFLDTYKNMAIPIKELAVIKEEGEMFEADYYLASQVEIWLQRIAPNIKLNIESNQEDFKLKYKFNRENDVMTDSFSAINTGFGITYVLPILVALLSANKGALIIIENPEAHIHPKGQAVLMQLIALAVKHGVQVIIETHSDHIINGSLVTIKAGIITNEDLAVYYFERDDSQHTAISHELEITKTGKIRKPPKGFFDQIDIDLKTLTGF